MIYKVQAKIIESKIGEFFVKLTDGTISSQKPDGEEIVASMKRAVITKSGFCEWYEMCFCPTPLYHERQTQYDSYFSEMTTQPVDEYGEVKGESLWSYVIQNRWLANHRIRDNITIHMKLSSDRKFIHAFQVLDCINVIWI